MNKDQNNADKRRPGSTSRTQKPLSASRRAPVSRTEKDTEAPKHPVRRKEPHHPASNRPSSAVKASRIKKAESEYDEENESGGSTAISSLVKAVIYIAAILVISGVLSYFTITVGNDVFAFVKSDDEITVTIGEGTTIKELGEILEDNGVIKYAGIFNLYAKLRDKNPDLVAGEYTVTPSMNYDQLIRVFAKNVSTKAETVIVTIPEGYTVKDIVDTLVDKYGLSTKEELYNVIENYEFDYWFVKQLDENICSDRMYRLEGYLYPDTYYYYTNASAVTIINKMLKNFDLKMKQTFKNCTATGDDYIEKINNLCTARGMTFDEIVILASMIQKEAFYDTEYGRISAVFNNRLTAKNHSTNGKLESDATVYYFLKEMYDEVPKELTASHLQIEHPYNTRLYKGLPPGPISNPTFLAINYALYPENRKPKEYYFVSWPSGQNEFASTYADHLKNIEKIKNGTKED